MQWTLPINRKAEGGVRRNNVRQESHGWSWLGTRMYLATRILRITVSCTGSVLVILDRVFVERGSSLGSKGPSSGLWEQSQGGTWVLGLEEAGDLCRRNRPGLGLPKYPVLLGLRVPSCRWDASMAEELSVFQVEQGSTQGRLEQALLGSDELLTVGRLFLLNTLWTVGFPGIQGKQRFVILLQIKKEKETLCVCVYSLGCQKQEDRNRGGERKIHFQSFGNSEVSLVTQGCSCFFFLCLFKLAFLLDEPRI